MSILSANTIPLLEQVIHFTHARHSVLAGNVANMDTPGYRVRDLSVETFQSRLKEAIETSKQQHKELSPGLIESKSNDPMREVKESMKNILFHDESDVSMEQQVTEISKNQHMHNLAISIMSTQFQMLRSAVSERP